MKFTGNPYQKYWWHEEQVATFKQMAKEGASLGEICKAFPNRKMENIILMARHISALNNNKVSEKNKAMRDDQKKNFTDIYAERGRKWTDMDDQRLMTMFFQLYSEDEISEQLHRSITAIQMRIMELHPTNNDKARLFERIRPYIGLKSTGKQTAVENKRASHNVVSNDTHKMIEGRNNNLTLSITTIGDLLLENKITRRMDGKPIDDVKLTVPEYQRPYKWTARNAIQLLDDVIEARNNNKEVYRVGTLILHQDKDGRYNIVDGQQRTITFSLLLHALYELEKDENRREIGFLNQQVFDNEFSRHNIPNNLNAFRRRIYKNTAAEENLDHIRDMKRLRDFIEKQCELIVVITDDVSEAFQFFDSQNARGKALYPHDLLKAYHLREMADIDEAKVEQIVKEWEKIPQHELAAFFGDYLYRVKEWINGNWANRLNEHNIYKFKGVNRTARTPYAQFYKSAYSYAQLVNSSAMPFVSGTREVNAFQLNTPIIAGKPFFDYTKHYYEILKDIQDNSQYEGFYIKGDMIVKTLDKYYSKGTGNRITRLLFDTALLLYVDRFCPATYPTKVDTELFQQFVTYAFIWAYSLRAQYYQLGWQSAQNYVLGYSGITNAFNIYKLIADTDSPISLLSLLADKLSPLSKGQDVQQYLRNSINNGSIDIEAIDDDGVYCNYLHFFNANTFYTE